MSNLIEQRIKLLSERLYKFLNEPLKTFNDSKEIELNGIYIVHRNGKPIYVGSSARKGHKRIGDLTSHWSNHTLHHKLLKEKLGVDKLVWCKKGKKSKHSKEQLIKEGKFTEQQFQEADKKVKEDIETNFRFRFINLSSEKKKDIKNFEHFSIAILNPIYND